MSAGSNAASLTAACVTHPKPTLPRPWCASPKVSPPPLGPVGPSAPSHGQWFVHCVHHFEKMLYDVAQLARVYLHAWILTSFRSQAVTGNEFFRTITEEILDYVMREMLDPEGVFYSTQDADSEGEEGKFFVWTPDEIWEILGSDADAFMAAYGVTPRGNASTGSAHGFEGKNILEFVGDMEQRPALAQARHRLFEAREKRVHPGRDDVQLAEAPTAKQCSRLRWLHCQDAHLVEWPDAGQLHQRRPLCRYRSPGGGRDAAAPRPVPAGLWPVPPGAGVCSFETASQG
jgi:hypothetical protein